MSEKTQISNPKAQLLIRVPAIHAVLLRGWKWRKNGGAGNKYCRLGSVTSFRSRRLRKAIMFISSLTAIQQNSVKLDCAAFSGGECRNDVGSRVWSSREELKGPLNVDRRNLRNPRMHRSSAHQLQGANRGNGVRRNSAKRKRKERWFVPFPRHRSVFSVSTIQSKNGRSPLDFRGDSSQWKRSLKISMIEHKIWAQHT